MAGIPRLIAADVGPREICRQRLPRYMVPDVMEFCEATAQDLHRQGRPGRARGARQLTEAWNQRTVEVS
jgi:LPS sulfotransferase NodH